MATSVPVDAGFLVALLSRRDANHPWAAAEASRLPAALGHVRGGLVGGDSSVGLGGTRSLAAVVRRRAIVCAFRFGDHMNAVLKLLEKYADVPMSLADACPVRMTETMNEPVLLTTDTDFRIYRRHGRQAIPCALPH